MSILDRALSIHRKVLNRTAGECIQYRRGSVTIELRAVPGETLIEDYQGDGDARIASKIVDFLISPYALESLEGGPEPLRGDQIVRANGDCYDVFQGVSDGVFEWSDSRETHYRVHTVRRANSVPIQ